MNFKLKMVFTDLDRTLLRDDRTISESDYTSMLRLGQLGIIRVIATGRSPYSVRKVIPESFPIDYIIFSSGAGIYDWRSQKIIRRHHLSSRQVAQAIEILLERNTDFMVHAPIPENHRFYFHGDGEDNSDFHQRIKLYRKHALPLLLPATINKSCQIIAIFPGTCYREYLKIMDCLTGVNVIRTTSPLDHRSHWMEIVPEEVSKALAAAWLAEDLNIPRENTMGIGNDYNDEALLEWTGTSFMVANGPAELKEKFRCVSSNQENGFSEAVNAELETLSDQ
ncbi:MAG TPA: HAD-IIB family hydrolase [Proteobacteria bacterium]|nr:HAD-IIB family hydrolase [Pseudomonadota bacterium]